MKYSDNQMLLEYVKGGLFFVSIFLKISGLFKIE